ncbi:unnamed protein product [Didymodactylos carnosus]|uniref:N-acetyltransferase domain-containing protein n=1 Tax=Didymodactylos carnosus TaxID=1234261 RepID=A0A813V6U8_9BILA|nr:unnamed protein product [Didymodactylos carnosus]CAF3625567.1 unnamed protein product [Didymodactylos carnosus]
MYEIDENTSLPIGIKVASTLAAQRPERITIKGQYVTITPLRTEHYDSLWEKTKGKENEAKWFYLFDGPFQNREAFDIRLGEMATSTDFLFYSIIDNKLECAVGLAALMRIDPLHRCIEIGCILYTTQLQKTRGATEAMYLFAQYVFDQLGYRRYEWKCNSLNEPSRQAALRLGFTFEGIFRQHMIVKHRNRDTAWYSIIDLEWPKIKNAFEQWLDSSNFDSNGKQKLSLSIIRENQK